MMDGDLKWEDYTYGKGDYTLGLKTQQSSTCIPWICGILWRMATTRFQLNTLYFLSLYCVLVCLSVLP